MSDALPRPRRSRRLPLLLVLLLAGCVHSPGLATKGLSDAATTEDELRELLRPRRMALVIGVDRLLDMFRTATNVVGDCTATCFVARLQGDAIAVLTPEQDAADSTRGMEGRLEGVEPHAVDVDGDA